MDARTNWREENRSAYLYRALARRDAGTERGEQWQQRAEQAEQNAANHAGEARKQGGRVPRRYHAGIRTRIVAALLRWFGAEQIYPVLVAMKIRGINVPSSAGTLRAGVFGMNDGLVSNAALIMGVAGGHLAPGAILLAGTAGLLAGAFSMGAGEYVSVRSQREMYENQIALEKADLEERPGEEARELAQRYEERGVSRKRARQVADDMLSDPEQAVETVALEQLGLDPDDLGSPWGAAISSFLLFSVGALVPLLPFALRLPGDRVLWSVGTTGLALFCVGAALSLFTGKNAWLSGARMLLIGGAAGLLTYAIGNLLGVNLA